MALFTNTCKDSFAVRQDLNLTDIVARVASVLVVSSVPDLSILTRHDAAVLRVWYIGNAKDSSVVNPEVKILSFTIKTHLLQIVERTLTRCAAVSESRVILKPVNAGDPAIMALANRVGWAIDGVEVVDVIVKTPSCGEHVTAVTEFNFAAILESD